MPTAVRIKSFRLGKRGVQQMQVTIPHNWIKENGLGEQDHVDMLKDTEGRLILIPGSHR